MSHHHAFIALALHSVVTFSAPMRDCIGLRGIIILMHFGLVVVHKKCPVCGGTPVIRCSDRSDTSHGVMRFSWECASGGHKHGHLRKAVKGRGLFQHIPIMSWVPVLHLITMLRRVDRWKSIRSELMDAYGIERVCTIRGWRYSIQSALRDAMKKKGQMTIGGDGEVAVFDETQIGIEKAVNTGTNRERTTSRSAAATRKRIKTRLPARTIHHKVVQKKPAAMKKTNVVQKKPAAMKTSKFKRGRKVNRKDKRSHALWVWIAVTVGRGKERFTHENGKKRVTFSVLPPSRAAPSKKPRGLKSISRVIKKHIKAKSFLVFDGWTSSKAAVERLQYRHGPPVNHSKGWRDRVTGYHSNDVESENNRFKSFIRNRYSTFKLNTDTADGDEEHVPLEGEFWSPQCSLELFEYCHYVNVGDAMADVMGSIAEAAGGKTPPFLL